MSDRIEFNMSLKSTRRRFLATASAAPFLATAASRRPIRLGGPIFLKSEDPKEQAKEHRRLGYSAAFRPHSGYGPACAGSARHGAQRAGIGRSARRLGCPGACRIDGHPVWSCAVAGGFARWSVAWTARGRTVLDRRWAAPAICIGGRGGGAVAGPVGGSGTALPQPRRASRRRCGARPEGAADLSPFAPRRPLSGAPAPHSVPRESPGRDTPLARRPLRERGQFPAL